jgi:hypothetical protein
VERQADILKSVPVRTENILANLDAIDFMKNVTREGGRTLHEFHVAPKNPVIAMELLEFSLHVRNTIRIPGFNEMRYGHCETQNAMTARMSWVDEYDEVQVIIYPNSQIAKVEHLKALKKKESFDDAPETAA